MKLKNTLIKDFVNIIYPKLCPACGNVLVSQEDSLCIQCLYHMPKTRFYDVVSNRMTQMFWGRVKIEYATSMFYFNKGGHYQQLLHHLKYKGKKEIGFELGKTFGHMLINSPLGDIDIIVPVPLHPSKQAQRGYNQSEWIATGMGHSLNKPVCLDGIERIRANESQTKKSKYQRWENVENIFQVKNTSHLEGKHILLVDDIITTGATLEACANEILKIGGVKLSISTIALANT